MRLARAVAALGLLVALVLPATAAAAESSGPDDVVVTVPSPTAPSGPGGELAITNAQLRWGLNEEAGSAAFAGGCNFLSAGRAGDSGGKEWTAAGGFYRAQEGNVSIEKPTAQGTWVSGSWDTKCLDARGNPVTLSTASGNQVVINGGTGRRTPAGVEIRWSGAFTVVFYGGMAYWSVTDPVLSLDAAGNGQLTGTATGFTASIDNPGQAGAPIPGRSIVLADIAGADISSSGFVTLPRYLGVTAAARFEQKQLDDRNRAYWGAFPESFLDFQRETGQLGFWLTTGGVRDAAKPVTEVYVSYDAAAPIVPPAPAPGGAGASPVNTANFRQLVAAAAAAPVPGAGAALVMSAPLTFEPGRDGLVPGLVATLTSPLLLPLLGIAFAVLVSILAVLNMMGALPWQQVRLRL